MSSTGAFFDIDGTLYRNSLMIQHFKKLIKYEVIDPAIWHNHVKHTYSEWENRYGDFEVYLEELADYYVKELKGINKTHIDFIASQVIKINGDKVYRYTRSRIDWHKKNGHKLLFISGGPDFLVEKMAEKYDVTEYKGSVYLVDEDNNFTGEVIRMWDSENKQKAIDKFVNKYDVDLDLSYSYGDTNGDFSMLKMVGNPIAINPNMNLLKSIKDDRELKDKVSIIVERKDIIYKLNPNVDVIEL
ncbi:HAD family hydrolase [Anaerosalibacter sp. Marseille-P3206]|uniref:HAD family hydrolase n=1 Tax=Anaerosalibacter sp. Marseille-P3206 TaxID=1871005 RepID=UPI000984451E|nr:HAD-IB family hydrolase [Anaerosalibacter sp. Marseille-P3206]